ncbi:MAG: GumN family protein [Flavipsychrobacter sp.]|nr:GumN family protein [Flavipsychrobacter sp.]
MKRIINFLSGLLILVIGCTDSFAQPVKQNNNSLLWRISRNKLTKPSYILGTMHLLCRSDYIWTKNMEKSLELSEKICFEMDMDDPSVLSEITTGLIDNSGKKLEDYFTPEQYKIVKKYVKDSIGMEISLFQHMKPVVLQTMMTVNSVICPNPVSYEDSLMKIAHKNKKEILGLEKPIEQIEVLESIPVDSVIHDLMTMIQDTNHAGDTDYTKLVAAYKAQDIRALYTLIAASKELGDMGIFLDGRNKKWIPRMTDKMKQSSVFFAVGAGHLGGDTGVIALLQKEGYTVVPVN